MRTGWTGPPATCWRSSRGGWSSSRSCWSPRSATATRARYDAGLPALHLEALPARRPRRCWTAALPGSRVGTRPVARRGGGQPARAGGTAGRLPQARRRGGSGCPGGCRSRRAWNGPSPPGRFDLPAATRTALLVAAVDDGTQLSEVLARRRAAAGGDGTGGRDRCACPAVAARLVEIDGTQFRFRHPLMRAAIRQEASVSQRQAAHAALAECPGQPAGARRLAPRGLGSRPGRDGGQGAGATAAAQAVRRGGTAVAVSALQRAADLSDGRAAAGRLLRAAELAFELGQHDLVPACWQKPNRSACHRGNKPSDLDQGELHRRHPRRYGRRRAAGRDRGPGRR